MFKRIGLFILTNACVMITAMLVLNLLGIGGYSRYARGGDYQTLMIICLVWGMAGSVVSLLMSKMIAKWTMGLKIINPKQASTMEQSLHTMVDSLARRARIKTPEVAIYNSPELNAFATGPTKNNSLVAVSSGLLNSMTQEELEGVLAHEVSHISNGDMVTLTLIQGVVNAFVMFFAKIAAWAVANAMQGDDEESTPSFWVVYAIEMVFYMIFGVVGAMVVNWFSRKREFKADQGAAKLSGARKISAALQRLKDFYENPGAFNESGQQSVACLKISSTKKSSFMELLQTHPPLEERIKRLSYL
jgi:heat shock protein HtpX